MQNKDLKLNVKKTNLVTFGYFRHECKTFAFGDEIVTTIDQVVFLGLALDSHWKSHIDNLSARISSTNHALRKLATAVHLYIYGMEYILRNVSRGSKNI